MEDSSRWAGLIKGKALAWMCICIWVYTWTRLNVCMTLTRGRFMYKCCVCPPTLPVFLNTILEEVLAWKTAWIRRLWWTDIIKDDRFTDAPQKVWPSDGALSKCHYFSLFKRRLFPFTQFPFYFHTLFCMQNGFRLNVSSPLMLSLRGGMLSSFTVSAWQMLPKKLSLRLSAYLLFQSCYFPYFFQISWLEFSLFSVESDGLHLEKGRWWEIRMVVIQWLNNLYE